MNGCASVSVLLCTLRLAVCFQRRPSRGTPTGIARNVGGKHGNTWRKNEIRTDNKCPLPMNLYFRANGVRGGHANH